MGFTKRLYEEIESVKRNVEADKINCEIAYLQLRDLGQYIDEQKAEMMAKVVDKVSLQPDCKMQIGNSILLATQKTTWKFDHISKWVEKKAELSEIEKELKNNYAQNQKFDTSSCIDEFERGFIEGEKKELKESAIPTFSKPFIKTEKVR